MESTSSRAIQDFLGEAEEILETLNLDLMSLGESTDRGDIDPDLVNGIFRGAHSIKGLAGMFGFDDISEFAHHMENMLDSLRLGKVSLSNTLVETLFDAVESLMKLVNGKSDSEDFTFDLSPMIRRIQAVMTGDVLEDADILSQVNLDPEILNVLTEYEEHRLRENLKKGANLVRVKAIFSLTSFDQDLAEVTDQLKKHGEIISTLPCAGDVTDQIAFQVLVGTMDPQKKIEQVLDRDDVVVELVWSGKSESPPSKVESSQKTLQSEPSGKEIAESASPDNQEPGASQSQLSAEGDNTGGSLRSISRTVRVDIEKLDSLMNIVGELVLSKGAITAICDRLKADGYATPAAELQKATRVFERRLDELQNGVMDVRMVPISQLFEKMARIVRRVSNEQGKKVNLEIRGADTELDKLIVEDLSDPLMHIIRNAIDHGLEEPEQRLDAGKPEKGSVRLSAFQKGNHVVIEVTDDGRGIDPEKVRQKAVSRGLVEPEAELTRQDIFDLVFMPGFSTRDTVSDLSGRGVGMDVVKTNISALSGMIEVDSQVGKGTRLSITLPITLAIIKALIVRVGSETYAIPINSVLETLILEPGEISTIERREVIELRQNTLPLLRLGQIFNLQNPASAEQRQFAAVVGLADKKMGVVVDELLGQQDVVIKSLGSVLSFVKGIAGAADLGNQKTILVLDVGGLMSEIMRGETSLYV